MYPTLAHALQDLFGVELQALKLVNTFGMMVALGFLGAALSLRAELVRKHAEGKIPAGKQPWSPPRASSIGNVVLSTLLAFLFGFKVLGLSVGNYALRGGTDGRRYILSGSGSWVLGALCAGLWLTYKLWERQRIASLPPEKDPPEIVEVLPQEHLLGITMSVAVGSLLGAKIFHLLERPSRLLELLSHPSFSALASGHTVYGGLILGAVGGYLYCRRHRLPFSYCVDAAAPGLLLGYAIGRLGCQLSGDGDWGIPSSGAPAGLGWLPSWVWSYDYPNNVMRAGVPMAEGGFEGYGTHLVPGVYPTPLYESVAAFAAFGLLWSIRKRIQRPLIVFGVYLMLNGFERFWIEKIRVNATYEILGRQVTQAELISVLLFLGGLGLICFQLRKPPLPLAASVGEP